MTAEINLFSESLLAINKTVVVTCPHCSSASPMFLKSIRQGFFGNADKFDYQCSKCGGMKAKTFP